MSRIQPLDGLRGLAVLAVMLYHFDFPFASVGFLGVYVFFVLSGYLITSILLRDWEAFGRIRWSRYWQGRILRLWPALFLLLVVSMPFADARAIIVTAAYLSNWCAVLRCVDMGALFPTWSLSIEWQFYLLWPPVLLLILRCRSPIMRILSVLAVAVVVALASALLWQTADPSLDLSYSSPMHANILLTGCALALALSSLGRPLHTRMWSGAASAGLILLLFLITSPMVITAIPLATLGSAAVIVGTLVAPESLTAKLLSWPPLTYVGRISYGLYLWHVPLRFGLAAMGLKSESPAMLALGLSLSFLVASISYRWIEQPALRLRTSAAADPELGRVTTAR